LRGIVGVPMAYRCYLNPIPFRVSEDDHRAASDVAALALSLANSSITCQLKTYASGTEAIPVPQMLWFGQFQSSGFNCCFGSVFPRE